MYHPLIDPLQTFIDEDFNLLSLYSGGESSEELVNGPEDDKISHVGTLENLPDENWFSRCGSEMEDYVTTAFRMWGVFVARHPALVIVVTVRRKAKLVL